MKREAPPTSGLPLLVRDFLPRPEELSFEGSLKEFLGVTDVLVTPSGTAAMLIALEALKRRSERKEVIVPAYTCSLVKKAVELAGLNLVTCDIQRERPDFDFEQLKNLCSEETLCIVPTHLAGIPSDMTAAAGIAKSCGAVVLEDAAQALGALINGKHAGTLGEIGFYSFAVGKGINLYEGGALAAGESEIFEVLKKTAERLLKNDIIAELMRCAQLIGCGLLYNPRGLHWVYGAPRRASLRRGDFADAAWDFPPGDVVLNRVSRFRKRAGARSLERYAAHLGRNRNRAARRLEALQSVPEVSVIEPLPGTEGTFPFFLLTAENPDVCRRIMDLLWASPYGVTKLFVNPLAELPNARSFADRSFTISNSEFLSEDDFSIVLEALTQR